MVLYNSEGHILYKVLAYCSKTVMLHEYCQPIFSHKNVFPQITWSGLMIGDLLTTLVRCGEYNKGVEVMQKISADPHIVLGSATVDSLQTLLDAAIKNNEANTGVVRA